MAQRRIPLQTGNFYHVYNRGNNRQTIFFERENYIYFLRLVNSHLAPIKIDVILRLSTKPEVFVLPIKGN